MAKATRDALPRREREIMNALFALGNRATAEEIRARLADPPTGSSVRVMLARLEKKGYLRHAEDGLRYVYSATESPDKAKRTALQRYVQTFFGGSLAQMVVSLVRQGSWTEKRARGARGRNSTRAEGEEPMMSFAVLAIVKATLVCGVAFFLSRLCRRTRASIRHLLFALAFTALVAIPGAGPVLPAVAVTVPAAATAPAPRPQDVASAVLSSAGADPSASSTPSVSREAAAARSVTIAQVVTAVWLIGVALFLIPVVVGFWQMRRLRARASPWTDGQALVQTLAPTLGVRRPLTPCFTTA